MPSNVQQIVTIILPSINNILIKYKHYQYPKQNESGQSTLSKIKK